MSHNNTPHLTTRGESKRLDSNANVNDGLASNSKQLLNAYVYDFLVKSRLPQTAKVFVNEAEIPSDTNAKSSPHEKSTDKPPNSPHSTQYHKDNNLPLLKVSMDAPQGFLYEWWLVFWDVYQAKSNKLSNPLASQYYQLQLMKQRQQQDFQQMNSMNNGNFNPQFNPTNPAHHYPTGPGPVNGPPGSTNGAGSQADIQQAQQRIMMQLMMNKQQAAAQNPNFNQMDPQQQQQYLASMNPNGQNPQQQQQQQQQQQMFMMQQQQQQQQQQNMAAQNKIQQHAQNQMNNLRQQAATQRHPDHQSPQGAINTNRGPNMQPNQNVRGGQGQMQVSNTSPGTNQVPQNGQFQQNNGYSNGNDPNQARMNVNFNNGNNGKNPNINMASGNSNAPINSRNINALHDYQMQLMLLEKQNKKRLDIARNSGSGESALTTLTAGMLPPNQQQMQQIQQIQNNMTEQQMSNQQNGIVTVNPNRTPTNPSKPSPTIGNKSSPKKGKGAVNKRGRKPSGGAGNNSTTPNTAATPSHLKREFSTPLTPTSETPNDSTAPTNNKRKRKNSNNNDSPKAPAKPKKDNTNTIKEEKEVKNDEVLNTMVPTSIMASNFNDLGHGDQMFTMDVLDDSNNQEQLFGGDNHNSNGLEDMDFDFNSFLDNNVNDGMNTFNWGGVDAIEDS